MTAAVRLDRQAWLEAGLELLADEGIDAVRITDLATRLSVTKGSFYWHFRDRAEFLRAMLDAWEAVGTDAVIVTVDSLGHDAKTKLHALFLKSFSSDGRMFLAIQGWAKTDAKAAAALKKIARRRIAYVEQLFKDFGLPAREAAVRAEFAFQALIGHYAMGDASMFSGKDRHKRLEVVFDLMLREAS